MAIPATATAIEGAGLTVKATITGGKPPYKCDWYLGTTLISVDNDGDDTLTLTSVGPTDAGDLTVKVTDSATPITNTKISNVCVVTITPKP